MPTEMEKLNKEKKNTLSAWQPVIGGLLAIAMAVFAWIASYPAVEWLDGRSNRFPPESLSGASSLGGSLMLPHINLVAAVVIWGVLLMAVWVMVAAFVPKKKSGVSDKGLAKERAEVRREALQKKKNRKKMAQKRLTENRKSGNSLGGE